MATQEQAAWVQRVLGVWTASDVPGQQDGPPDAAAVQMEPAELLALFRNSKDEVDEGLSELQAEMRKTADVDMIRVADYGMFGMTDGEGVGLMKALFELRAATPDKQPAALAAAGKAASAYKKKVFEHTLIDLVDRNPFGVEVGIRAKLGAALDTIANAA